MSLPQPQPGIMSIKPYVAGKSKAGTQKIIKLSSNENNLGPSPLAIQAAAESATKMHRYPDSGCAELRQAIAEVQGLDADRIVCGAGSDELIGLLVNAYAGPEDEVLYSQHGFLMYKIYTLGAGATPVVAPEKHLTADVDALLAHVTSHTKLVFIANPNNPTGSCIPASELKRLHAGLPKNVILVIDDAYAEYVEASDYTDGRELVDAAENAVMLRTFSKIYGLSSLRLGWGYFPKAVADVLNRVRGPFNVSAVAQAAGVAAIKDVEYVKKIKAHNTQWREWVAGQLASNVMTVHPSAANFILVQFPGGKLSAQAANAFLLERGIIPREVGEYGLPDCLRITIGTEEENRALVDGLKAFVDSNA